MRLALALAFALAAALAAADALAARCDVSEVHRSSLLTASALNMRARQLEACINGAVGNTNWRRSEPFANDDLEKPNSLVVYAWTIADEDGDATAGENVPSSSPPNYARRWTVPNDGYLLHGSVEYRCPGGCAGFRNPTIEVRRNGTAILTISAGTLPDTVVTANAVTSLTAVTAGDEIQIRQNGSTTTGVDFIHVVLTFALEHEE